jgi:hypothetical protein
MVLGKRSQNRVTQNKVKSIIDHFLDTGGNHSDPPMSYAGGRWEELVGAAIQLSAEKKRRTGRNLQYGDALFIRILKILKQPWKIDSPSERIVINSCSQMIFSPSERIIRNYVRTDTLV